MSAISKDTFKRSVVTQQVLHNTGLCISSPAFTDEGFTTTALMTSGGGRVELRCGPAEYHVELFIHPAEKKRLGLVELLAMPGIREWMRANRANLEGKQRVEAEVEYAFRLLDEIVSLVPELQWLRRK